MAKLRKKVLQKFMGLTDSSRGDRSMSSIATFFSTLHLSNFLDTVVEPPASDCCTVLLRAESHHIYMPRLLFLPIVYYPFMFVVSMFLV